MVNNKKISFKQRIDYLIFGTIINWAYPKYFRPKYGYISYYRLFFHYFIPQKILRINAAARWPVHFTSKIESSEKITKGILCDPGDNNGIYIQAKNGIVFGNNVGIGSGAAIISANHTKGQHHTTHDAARPIVIGNNVFIYANAVVLPGVHIGDNVIIGAGSVVTKDIPSNSIAVGNPCKVIKENLVYSEDFTTFIFNKEIPEKFRDFIDRSRRV